MYLRGLLLRRRREMGREGRTTLRTPCRKILATPLPNHYATKPPNLSYAVWSAFLATGFRFPIGSTSSWQPWHTKYGQHPNRHIFSSTAVWCHYAPHKDLCSRCHGLKLHMAVTLSVWLYQTHGINYPPMFSLRIVWMFFIGDWRHIFSLPLLETSSSNVASVSVS